MNYKIGIIGTGAIATRIHIPVLKEINNTEITALCDIRDKRAEKVNTDFLLNARTFTDYKEMLRSEKLDAVHICTPNYLHAEMAVAALNAGLNVFCEKPDTISVKDALEMKAAEKRSGKTLMVMRNNRFVDSSVFLNKYIQNGEAGEIYAARCGWQRRRGIPGKGGWFTTKAQSGGGPLIDLGVHMMDLTMYLMGNPKPVTVSGSAFTKFANSDISDSLSSVFGDKEENGVFDVEDLAMGFIKFENGACMQIEFSWASNIEKEKSFVELRGTKAGALWEGGKLRIFGENNNMLMDISPTQSGGNGHERNIRHFYAVLGGEKPIFTIEQGINMIEIICGIYESARTGREVVLK